MVLMSEPRRRRENLLLVVGLPVSGKSTFIGALYNVLEDDSVPLSCKWNTSPDDASYAHELAVAWGECRPPERTGLRREILLHLKHLATNSNFELRFPDVAGEVFEHQWQLRGYSPTYAEDIDRATGIILFVSPIVRTGELIRASDQKLAETFGSMLGLPLEEGATAKTSHLAFSGANATENQRALVEAIARHPERTPTQVMLVELLQFIARRRGWDSAPLPVAVVISMWDGPRGEDSTRSPSAWQDCELPLLSQYLRSNATRFPSRVFGISAQGGDYENKEDYARLTKMITERAQRVIVDDPPAAVESHDITLPLDWILTELNRLNSYD